MMKENTGNKYLVSYRTNKGIDVGRNNNRQINKKKKNVYLITLGWESFS